MNDYPVVKRVISTKHIGYSIISKAGGTPYITTSHAGHKVELENGLVETVYSTTNCLPNGTMGIGRFTRERPENIQQNLAEPQEG